MTREELFNKLLKLSDEFYKEISIIYDDVEGDVELETEFVNYLKTLKKISESEYKVYSRMYLKKYGE